MDTIHKVKVRNMTSDNRRIGPLVIGKPVPNQFVITTDEGEYFQSYNSVIAYKPRDLGTVAGTFQGSDLYPRIILDEKYWDYSTTTGKYRNQFLGEDKAETQKKINSGEYELADLNA